MPDNLAKEQRGNTPFGVYSKLLLHLDNLNGYVQNDDAAPICMEFNLTNRCNLKCAWCISGNLRADENIEQYLIDLFFEDYRKLGGKSIIFTGGGEPTLHEYFGYIAQAAFHEGLDLGLLTNGLYPPRYKEIIGNCFKWVRFSVDTFMPRNYKAWKGPSNLSVLRTNIKNLRNYGCKVWLNCNISEDHEIEDISSVTIWLEDVDGIQFRPVLPRHYKDEEIPRINERVWNWLKDVHGDTHNVVFSRDMLEDLDNPFDFKHCDGHFFIPTVNANGDVCVCIHKTKDPRFIFGNIYENRFQDIWNSQKRKDVIEFVRGYDYSKDCQVGCKLAATNKFLDFLKYAERPRDVNFL